MRWVVGLVLAIIIIGFYLGFPSPSCKTEFNAQNTLTSDNLYDVEFFQHWNDESCKLYFEFGGRVYREEKSNIVGIDGQKAVCLDPGLTPPIGLCVVYSFGLSDDWSFDIAMESYGCDVYAFDPSIKHPQLPNNTKRVHYFNFGLGTRNIRKDSRGNK